MKKLLMIALLTLTLGYGTTFALTCQQELKVYKSLYVKEKAVTKTLTSIIKDTNLYIVCLWGVELGYDDYSACDSKYKFYIGTWNILYKNGYVGYKLTE